MSELSPYAKKILPVALLAGVALSGSAYNQPTEQVVGPAPAAMRQAYNTCKMGDDMNAYKVTDTSNDTLTVQYPMKIEKNSSVVDAPDSTIVYRGLVARINDGGGRETPLFSTASDMSYDETTDIVTHTIPKEVFSKHPNNVTLTISAQVEEDKMAKHHLVDVDCGDVLVRPTGPEPTMHTANTDQLDISDRIVFTPVS